MNVRSAFATALTTSLLMMGCQNDDTVEDSQLAQAAATDQACLQSCLTAAREGQIACLNATNDREGCGARFQAGVRACESRCRAPEPPPAEPPAGPSCEQTCTDAISQNVERCTSARRDPAACATAALQQAGLCLADCNPNERPANRRCQQACTDRASQAFQPCVTAGRDVKACATQATQILRRCQIGCRQ